MRSKFQYTLSMFLAIIAGKNFNTDDKYYYLVGLMLVIFVDLYNWGKE